LVLADGSQRKNQLYVVTKGSFFKIFLIFTSDLDNSDGRKDQSIFYILFQVIKSTKENENLHDDEKMRRVKERREKLLQCLKGISSASSFFPFNSSAREL